jgi:DNA-binding MarR family transcriptional regulator
MSVSRSRLGTVDAATRQYALLSSVVRHGMLMRVPRRSEPMLGDELVDAYRAFVGEIYEALAFDGFPDLPQVATTVFRDIDGSGSLVSDLAVQAGMSTIAMQSVVDELVDGGYVERDGERVSPAARGHNAFAAGRRALAAAEERLARRVGPERVAVFRSVLREMAADPRGRPRPCDERART